MKTEIRKVLLYFSAGILLQAGAYLYLDQVLFSTTADYNVSDVERPGPAMAGDRSAYEDIALKGKAYYSFDNAYMADVAKDSVTIYRADDLDNPQRVDLKGKGVSFLNGCRTAIWRSWLSIRSTGGAGSGT